MHPTSDDDLMLGLANGDEKCAIALTRRHLPRCLAHATRMVNDGGTAQDLTQEAFVRLWQNAAGWQAGRAQISTWLYRVVGNLAIDYLRKSARVDVREVTDADMSADAQDGEAVLAAKQRDAVLMEAMQTLPPRQRMAVSLRYLEEVPNREIADIMGVSVEAVEGLTKRGKHALRVVLAGNNIHEQKEVRL